MLNISKTGDLKIKDKMRKLDKWMNNTLLDDIGEIAYAHFMKSFPKNNSSTGGRQTNASKNGWKKRKKKYKHPALVKTGRLKNSIKVLKKRFFQKSVTIYTKVFYAEYQNNGTGRLPKREYIGDSDVLNKNILYEIKNGLEYLLS